MSRTGNGRRAIQLVRHPGTEPMPRRTGKPQISVDQHQTPHCHQQPLYLVRYTTRPTQRVTKVPGKTAHPKFQPSYQGSTNTTGSDLRITQCQIKRPALKSILSSCQGSTHTTGPNLWVPITRHSPNVHIKQLPRVDGNYNIKSLDICVSTVFSN